MMRLSSRFSASASGIVAMTSGVGKILMSVSCGASGPATPCGATDDLGSAMPLRSDRAECSASYRFPVGNSAVRRRQLAPRPVCLCVSASYILKSKGGRADAERGTGSHGGCEGDCLPQPHARAVRLVVHEH